MERLLKIHRKQEKIKPPHRVGQKLAKPESPRFTPRQQALPRVRAHPVRRVALNQPEFFLRYLFVSLRRAVKEQPRRQPEKAQRTRNQKGRLPSESGRQPRHRERRDYCADVGPRVEYAGSVRPLPPWKPLRHRLNA